MSNALITVKGRIQMKKAPEGGRKSGFKSGYRPNHVFEMPKNLKELKTNIGDIRFEYQELIELGETKILTVGFLRMLPDEKYIKVGQQWFINEGAKSIGYGEILEICS